MNQLSKHFNLSEFKCKCGLCISRRPDQALIIILEMLHMYLRSSELSYKIRIKITSGNRCFSHNRKIGGSEYSEHTVGKAADVKCYVTHYDRNKSPHWIKIEPSYIHGILALSFPKTLGLGEYKSFTHIDIREIKARWEVK